MTKMATANLCEAEIDGIMIAASQLYELKAAEHEEDEILLQASQRYEVEAHQEAQQTYLVDNAASDEILLASQRYEA